MTKDRKAYSETSNPEIVVQNPIESIIASLDDNISFSDALNAIDLIASHSKEVHAGIADDAQPANGEGAPTSFSSDHVSGASLFVNSTNIADPVQVVASFVGIRRPDFPSSPEGALLEVLRKLGVKGIKYYLDGGGDEGSASLEEISWQEAHPDGRKVVRLSPDVLEKLPSHPLFERQGMNFGLGLWYNLGEKIEQFVENVPGFDWVNNAGGHGTVALHPFRSSDRVICDMTAHEDEQEAEWDEPDGEEGDLTEDSEAESDPARRAVAESREDPNAIVGADEALIRELGEALIALEINMPMPRMDLSAPISGAAEPIPPKLSR